MSELLANTLPIVAQEEGIDWEEDCYEQGQLCPSEKERIKTSTNKLTQKPEKLPIRMESMRHDIEFRQSNRSADFIQGIEEEDSDARSIVIKPWDKSMFRVIEKAIIDSDLGIMPENNGEMIRIGIPPLTEERRKQLAKQCKGEGETAKVSVRNARRDGIDALKKAVKDGLAEDEQKNAEAKLQKIHDKYIKQIDDMLAEKDKEIMTV